MKMNTPFLSLCILFFLISTNTLYTHINNQEIFLEANALYHTKDYQKALDHYRKIEKKGWAVLYNMANCYYFLNNYCMALVYWQRALSHNPEHARDAIQYNCQVVADKLNSVTTHESHVGTWLTTLSNKFSLFTLQLLFLVLLYLFMLIVNRLWSSKRYSVLIVYTLILLWIGFLLVYRWHSETTSRGIVLEHAHLCSGTDIQFKKNDMINAGNEVVIIDERPNWVHIRDKNNGALFGWVKKSCIEVI